MQNLTSCGRNRGPFLLSHERFWVVQPPPLPRKNGSYLSVRVLVLVAARCSLSPKKQRYVATNISSSKAKQYS